MPKAKLRRRKVLILAGALVALTGLLVLCVPIWFPWLARPVARSLGFEYEQYRRLGFHRFEMTGVTGRVANVEIRADRFTALLPHGWLWQRWRTGAGTNDYVFADQWTVRIHPRQEPPPDEPRIQSTLELLDAIDRIARTLQTWLPVARLTRGTVELPGTTAAVPEIRWRAGQLDAGARVPELSDMLSLRVDATQPGQWEMIVEDGRTGFRATTGLARESTSWDLNGVLQWESNRVEVAARFEASQWLPIQATLAGRNLAVPTEYHRLPMFGPLHGSIDFQWRDGSYALTVRGLAEPTPETGPWPPLEFALDSRGDLARTVLERIEVRAPWCDLQLLGPATVAHSGPRLVTPATFELNADLNGVHPAFTGVARAEIEVEPSADTYPTAALRLWSDGVSAAGLEAKNLEGRGRFHWPLVELETARVSLGDGVSTTAVGVVDLEKREVRTAVMDLEGGDLAAFLPDALAGEGLRAHIEVTGPFDRMEHEGDVRLERLAAPPLNPTALSFQWQGAGLESVTYTARAEAGDSRLLLEGLVTRGMDSPVAMEVRLDGLTLQRSDESVYQLERTAHLQWLSETNRAEWRLDELAWRGSGDQFLAVSGDVRWPDRGHAGVTARQVALSDFRDFLTDARLPIVVSSLNVAAGWTNGPLHWNLETATRTDLREYQTLEIGLRARGDESGTTVERLSAGGWEAPPLTGEGHLPLVLDPADEQFARLLPEAPLEFRVHHEPVAKLTVNLGQAGQLQLSQPMLDVRVSGTASQPRGELNVALDGVESVPPMAPGLPRFARARMEAELQPRLVRLRRLEFELDGQPVKVEGELPLTGDALLDFASTAPDWQGATGRVVIEQAELSPVARRFPKLLTSQGGLALDLSLRPGLIMDGFLSLTNAMTRPLGLLAPVRDIDALIAFSGRTARVERFTGRLGGRPIHATGHATLGDDRALSYAVRVQGTNAPLVRKPGLLVRADLDLALRNPVGEVPTVSGKVQLRDGLLLQDVSSLLIDRLERPALRPPYFSVTNSPFARWQLNVDVSGDRFLRLRSPAFVGELSANGTVRGSLGKPVISAELRVPRGRILFPFGKLEVEGAYVTVSAEQPAGPMIDLVAAGQNYNYNVRLEANGSMDNLNVLFTSTPPLSSEDILLMLTAGELPNREITYSAEARAGRLITYLGREVATRFFGNEMGEEKLIVNSGENIARSGRTTYSIEYLLTPRWSLVGEYDEFNALNAGLKWRIYAR